MSKILANILGLCVLVIVWWIASLVVKALNIGGATAVMASLISLLIGGYLGQKLIKSLTTK